MNRENLQHLQKFPTKACAEPTVKLNDPQLKPIIAPIDMTS
jgi:hypothetical protein